MKTKTIIFSILILISVFSCMPSRYSETRLSITSDSTTPVTGIIYAKRQPDWNKIFSYLESKARLYDHRIKGSPVEELNSNYEARLPDEVFKTMVTALEIAQKSNGAFDPTILPLMRLWNFDFSNKPKLPDPRDISIAMSHVDYKKVVLSGNNMALIPEKTGIDLGGIAAGALADSLADYFNTLGYENFVIEAGGEIVISGLKPGNKKWIIGIRHPRNESELIGELSMGTSKGRISVVTSGDYEKYFEQDGIRYHHIIDPHTGYPAWDVISVTVIAPTCTEADALSTAVFVLGRKEGLALLEKGKDTEGILIYEKDGKLKYVMTEGFSLFLDRISL